MGRQDYETETLIPTGGFFDEAPRIGVRRLTPKECERLQGFPDSHTLVAYRGKPAADGPRYKAIGNSMAVPVMRWIGKRIKEVNHRMRYT
jgi:DNA (cytosine-5)-methyltransferase 1